MFAREREEEEKKVHELVNLLAIDTLEMECRYS
jgi:hypothetical protein